MNIWVDADACPGAIKEILFRVSERTQLPLTLVANHAIRTPASKLIKFIQVPQGFDVADNEIVKRLSPGDIVITADIPLAAEVIDKGGRALNPRGELYTTENIKARLNMRDFMDSLRSSGVNTGGPPPLGPKDQQAFANQLDRIVTRHLNNKKRDEANKFHHK
ncbi:MAG: YaiI/YqxD family protein [Proteobacteria bacterium]|nr:YaiI/YqxD family protein [Pseudomonadota bacterium]